MAVKVLPTWVEAVPLKVDPCHEPKAVLVVGTSSVPSSAWSEVILALEWIGWDHPGLRFLICGDSHERTELDGARWQRAPSIAAPESLGILQDRPICLVVYTSGRPPWLHDLIAKGCPVIAVMTSMDRTSVDAEFNKGIIQVPANGRVIAQTIDSLLIDPVRLGGVTIHGAAYIETLARPIETAPLCSASFAPPVHRM